MKTIDIRDAVQNEISEIVFADATADDGSLQANRLSPHQRGADVRLYDGSGDYVYLNSIEHARNLIKGLEKVIELGWLK